MNDEKYQKLVSSVSESDLFFQFHLKNRNHQIKKNDHSLWSIIGLSRSPSMAI